MKKLLLIFSIMGLCLALSSSMEAKRVKHSLKIDKKKENNDKGARTMEGADITGTEIMLTDSLEIVYGDDNLSKLREISFAGYDKEINSNKESFIIVNSSDYNLTGYKVRIDYIDLQDRMFHTRIVDSPIFVPARENRHIDIKSWDLQHTYYYYLGNEPKKVATPFKVKFTPLSFRIEKSDP